MHTTTGGVVSARAYITAQERAHVVPVVHAAKTSLAEFPRTSNANQTQTKAPPNRGLTRKRAACRQYSTSAPSSLHYSISAARIDHNVVLHQTELLFAIPLCVALLQMPTH